MLQKEIDLDVEALDEARRLANAALDLLGNVRKSYVRPEPEERRRWNRIIFREILIGDRQVKRFEYQEPYLTLFAWAGSNKGGLVSPSSHYLNRRRPRPLGGEALLDLILSHHDQLVALTSLSDDERERAT